MIEQAELTRGQKIDKGDIAISFINETKRLADAQLVETVDSLRKMLKNRIDGMVKLGCVPTMRIAKIELRSGDAQNIREAHFLEISTMEETDHSKTVLDLQANLLEVEMSYSGGHWFIKEDSMIPFNPSRYIPYIHPVLDAMAKTIHSAQEQWFAKFSEEE